MVWNYKIVLIVTTANGITSQMLHYQDYDMAEEAYRELEAAPEVPNMLMTAIRLYKLEHKYGRMGR
jgi:hypothetical protein